MIATLRRVLISTSFMLAVIAMPADAAQKRALVIGINDYKEVPKLEKAVGDAQAIAQTLAGLGYQVTTALDVDRRSLNLALSKLYASVEPGDTVLVHYSGHGVQIENDNYLLPADVPAPDDGNVELLKSESLRLLTLVDTLGDKGAGARILIIDACRDNPFAKGGKRSIGGTRGLANVATDKGTFIMYSAGAGQAALDRLGDADPTPTSVYTRVLLSRLGTPGTKLRDLAASVRDEVEQMGKSVGHDQRPAYYDDLPADFTLAPADATASGQQQQVLFVPPKIIAPAQTAVPNVNEEARFAWEAVKEMTTPAPFDVVAQRYPGTIYGDLAATRAKELRDSALRAAQERSKQAALQQLDNAPPPAKSKSKQTQTPGNLRWGVIVGSFPKSQTSKARGRLKAARAQGYDAQLINTDQYGRLAPGLFAVVIGANSRDAALNLAAEVQNHFGDAYAKQLQ